MSEDKTFEEEVQPIIDTLESRAEFAKRIAGQNLYEGCQVFRLPLPPEVWKFEDESTHNTRRGPGYLYIFISQEGSNAMVEDDGGHGCYYKTPQLIWIPINESDTTSKLVA